MSTARFAGASLAGVLLGHGFGGATRGLMVTHRRVGGVPAKVTLQIRHDLLVSVSLDVTGPAATVAAYRAIQAALRVELGSGRAVRCEGETGAPIEEDIARGVGLLQTSWSAADVRAQVGLANDFGAPGALHIFGFACDPRRLLPCEDGSDVLCRGGDRGGAPSSRRDPPAKRAPTGTGPLVSSPAAGTCAAAAASAPHAELLGLTFGADRRAAKGVLGRPMRDLGIGVAAVDMHVAGVPGELTMNFYGECLATVLFRVAAATPAAYESVRAWARTALGDGTSRRCGAEAAPGAALATADHLSTRWAGGGPLRGELRFDAHPDWDVGGSAGPAHLVLEVEHEALRPFAPRIDFAEGE